MIESRLQAWLLSCLLAGSGFWGIGKDGQRLRSRQGPWKEHRPWGPPTWHGLGKVTQPLEASVLVQRREVVLTSLSSGED